MRIIHPAVEDVVPGKMLYSLQEKFWFIVLGCHTCAARNPSLQKQLDSYVKENLREFAVRLEA